MQNLRILVILGLVLGMLVLSACLRATATPSGEELLLDAATAVPACEACIRTELDHAEGNNSAGECVAVSAGADEWIDVAS